MSNTLPSNSTSLSLAKETSPGVLPGSPVWYQQAPNNYSDFGGSLKLESSKPITPGRQRFAGAPVDKDAAIAFNQDFTQNGFESILDGFFFAAWSRKLDTTPTGVTSTVYQIPSTTGLVAGDLIGVTGCTNSANNGLKVAGTIVANTSVAVSGLVAETPATTAKLTKVGVRAGSGDITVTVSGTQATIGSTTLDFTTQSLVAGEWIWIGGDATANKFATAATNGFYRISTIAAHALVCDRIPTSAATDTGSGKLIDLYFGHVIHNQDLSANIVTSTYTAERQLDTAQFETMAGCYCGGFGINVDVGKLMNVDLSFVGTTVSYGTSAASGTRISAVSQAAFNATSHVSRLRMLDSTGASFFAYVTGLKINIDNNLQPVKAVSVLGNLDVVPGDFAVDGTATAYFTTTAAVAAVNSGATVSLDVAFGRANAGWLFDIPYCVLGDAKITVEKDKPITLPISAGGSRHPTLTYTCLAMQFRYLPTLAAP